MADTSALPAAAAVPSVRRRLAAMLYEAVLLFGIVFFAGLAFALATQQRNGLVHHNLLAAWIALVVGAYFVWFWTHGGQTLPMKTWRLRLEAANGRPLSAGHAIVRYALGWLWFLPPLALHPLLGLSVPVTLVLAAAWIVVWAGAARLHADRQFPHDRLARTRIVAMPR
ncbi:RDD family protein [Burkholderia multivorans]|uniref:RDD domain-containing protein n=1 Tax=Burkholderia multivorans TaxID=87883 RepID=A0A8E2RWD0_9BURK|nr:RDD family protein [Burkholderia multivorans]MCA8262933.1 RDD family protein [Burkholderia multivorans]MCL4626002.1 RDD family protein [Burkholderia multivorans]MCO1361398.1 RDD family protein [Burkholderia multivorans]MCO1381672.1 RDD family protein [Burkholderia multivorans]MCO1388140.1 RDD family protein [Burkholderia multivorans]